MAITFPDRTSLAVSVASLCVSAAAAYFAWSRSPFFDAPPERMAYWYIEANDLTKDMLPSTAELKVVVFNDSPRPARDVLVVVTPLYPKAAITCNAPYDVQDGPKGSVLVTLSRIPPKGSAEVHVSEEVSAYPPRFSYLGGAKCRYCANVSDVQTGFGAVRCEYRKCEERIKRLPGDDGVSPL